MYLLKIEGTSSPSVVTFSEIKSETRRGLGATYIISGTTTESDQTIALLIKNKITFDATLEGNSTTIALSRCFFCCRTPLPPYQYQLEVNLVD